MASIFNKFLSTKMKLKARPPSARKELVVAPPPKKKVEKPEKRKKPRKNLGICTMLAEDLDAEVEKIFHADAPEVL